MGIKKGAGIDLRKSFFSKGWGGGEFFYWGGGDAGVVGGIKLVLILGAGRFCWGGGGGRLIFFFFSAFISDSKKPGVPNPKKSPNLLLKFPLLLFKWGNLFYCQIVFQTGGWGGGKTPIFGLFFGGFFGFTPFYFGGATPRQITHFFQPK